MTVRRALLLAMLIFAIMILPTGGHALAKSGSIHDFFSPDNGQSGISNTSLGGAARNNVTANATTNTTSNRTAAGNVTPEIFGTDTGRLAMNVTPANKSVTLGVVANAGELGARETTAFNSKAARTSDAENISIDFPYFQDDKISGPVAGAGPERKGTLPFGPVDLAFPSIRQSVEATIESDSTSFMMSDRAEAMSYPDLLFKKTKLPAVYFEL